MKNVIFLFVVSLLFAAAAEGREVAVGDGLIAEVNSRQRLWTAARNHVTDMSPEEARGLLGVDLSRSAATWPGSFEMEYSPEELANAPDAFDARQRWPNCSSIGHIRDQRRCGSCWAFGAVEAMSDRECIAHGTNEPLSAEDMNSCSKHLLIRCGSCNGGLPACAWAYWASKGVVTEACAPYTAGTGPEIVTPPCPSQCTGDTSRIWSKDKHVGKSHYSLSGEAKIMADIEKYGPVEVAFTVYTDFMSYSGGVYHHVSGKQEGGHAVKMLGWGVENGAKYWLCANSWGTSWGEKGFFRIRRGTNECGIEKQCWAGLPK